MNRIRKYFVEIIHAKAFQPGGEYVVMTQDGFEEMKQWMVEQRSAHRLPDVPDVPFWPMRLKKGTLFDA